MDVLNTYGGEAVSGSFWWATGFAVMAIICVLTAIGAALNRLTGFAVIFVLLACVCVMVVNVEMDGRVEPVRHEVTLRPGHVIDATKWEIVEQRGKIYVIEEREVAE